jgi:hypothetical protein
VAGGSNGGVNRFNAIEDGGEVKRGIKGEGGMMVGRVTARAASEVWNWAAWRAAGGGGGATELGGARGEG